VTTIQPLTVPLVPFGRVQGRMARLWDPFARNPHIGVFGFTGSGKSHLIRYGILPLRPYSRTVVIDVKDDRDQTWDGFGQTVTELPPAFFKSADGARWRLIVDRANPKPQLRNFFHQIRGEGHCIVVMDETRSITEREQIGLGSDVENLITEGRGIGVTMIMGTQSTAWAVPSVKDQPGALFIGQTNTRDEAMKLAGIAGLGRDLALTVGTIPPHRWLYRDRWAGPAVLALTDSPAA
jgi:DNA helicase HerA-like ATPase